MSSFAGSRTALATRSGTDTQPPATNERSASETIPHFSTTTTVPVPAARTLDISFRAFKRKHAFAPPPGTPDERVWRLLIVYRELRPVLDALYRVELMPPLWKWMIGDLASAIEAVAGDHLDPATPDFRAGRDL
jgi:hypothetical protein